LTWKLSFVGSKSCCSRDANRQAGKGDRLIREEERLKTDKVVKVYAVGKGGWGEA
jgi:hypothetical protein